MHTRVFFFSFTALGCAAALGACLGDDPAPGGPGADAATEAGDATASDTGPGVDGGGPDSAAPVDASGSVRCGTATCTGGQVCCEAHTGNARCTASRDCSESIGLLRCDDPSDCPAGQMCCAISYVPPDSGGDPTYVSTACAPGPCAEIELCSTREDCRWEGGIPLSCERINPSFKPDTLTICRY